jgi:hypothetical protein
LPWVWSYLVTWISSGCGDPCKGYGISECLINLLFLWIACAWWEVEVRLLREGEDQVQQHQGETCQHHFAQLQLWQHLVVWQSKNIQQSTFARLGLFVCHSTAHRFSGYTM